MACRGYIRKDFPDGSGGDRFRARWVKEPYDAYDEDVPHNQVIFDSDDLGNMAILATGSALITERTSGSINLPILENVVVASWDYDFVPYCLFMFSRDAAGSVWSNTYPDRRLGPGGPSRLEVTKTGIRLFAAPVGAITVSTPMHIRWVAFKVSAT